MSHADEAVSGQRVRRRRAVSEKVAIVRLTMEPGASVAEIARAHGVNANQVFKWRRLFERGQLGDVAGRATALLPVAISAAIEAMPEPTEESAGERTCSGGANHAIGDDDVKCTSLSQARSLSASCASRRRACRRPAG